MDSLVTRLPAVDEQGAARHYFAEFSIPEAGTTQHYLPEGTLDLLAADEFIPVEVGVENAIQPGDKVFEYGYYADLAFDATGRLMVCDYYSEVNINGQTAVTPDGALYVMSSTPRGIEVHYVAPPSIQGE
jgi:hypothetical protein